MKNTKLVAILVLQAVLVMGILSHVNADFFPTCCDNCRSFSGVDVCDGGLLRPCDDAHPQCPTGCSACRVVTMNPTTYRCADMKNTVDGTCGGPCKKY